MTSAQQFGFKRAHAILGQRCRPFRGVARRSCCPRPGCQDLRLDARVRLRLILAWRGAAVVLRLGAAAASPGSLPPSFASALHACARSFPSRAWPPPSPVAPARAAAHARAPV